MNLYENMYRIPVRRADEKNTKCGMRDSGDLNDCN